MVGEEGTLASSWTKTAGAVWPHRLTWGTWSSDLVLEKSFGPKLQRRTIDPPMPPGNARLASRCGNVLSVKLGTDGAAAQKNARRKSSRGNRIKVARRVVMFVRTI